MCSDGVWREAVSAVMECEWEAVSAVMECGGRQCVQ